MPDQSEWVSNNGHCIDAVGFRRALVAWGRQHFRLWPWRLTEDSYKVLIAEVMLHRTQASQVAPVYQRLVERYPDALTLARANAEELRNELCSLGLRWRVDLIHKMASSLVQLFGGAVPEEKTNLLTLPGVSEYIAGATRCFVWNLPEPLVDTNTTRVVGRLFELPVKESSRRNRKFKGLIAALVDPEEPRAYNYALLDLADQVCMTKRPPICEQCPVSRYCVYGGISLGIKGSRPE